MQIQDKKDYYFQNPGCNAIFIQDGESVNDAVSIKLEINEIIAKYRLPVPKHLATIPISHTKA